MAKAKAKTKVVLEGDPAFIGPPRPGCKLKGVRLEGQDGAGDNWCPFDPIMGTIIGKEVTLEEKSKGGLLLTSGVYAKAFFSFMRVMRVGPGKIGDGGYVLPCPVNVGDLILVAACDVATQYVLGHTWGFIQMDQSWCRVREE